MPIFLPVVASCVRLTQYDFPLCFTTTSTILSEKSTFQNISEITLFSKKSKNHYSKNKKEHNFICNLYHTITKKEKATINNYKGLYNKKDITRGLRCNNLMR